MTKEQKEKALAFLKDMQECTYDGVEEIRTAIESLEQQPSNDVMAIHTQGLDEGIRCAMCTNSMRSDRGCDGGCVVNEDMYKKVMETINNQMFSQPTSDDCVSRKAVLDTLMKYEKPCDDRQDFYLDSTTEFEEEIKEMQPVTPTHGTCKDCKYNRPNSYARTMFSCERGNRFKLRDCENFYCADFEKRGNSDGSN